MYLYWKRYEMVKVVCKFCKFGQVYEIVDEFFWFSKGIIIDIKFDNIIIFYCGKNYVQLEVMFFLDMLLKNKVIVC